MDLAGEIMRTTPAAGAELAEAAKHGDPAAVRRYTFFAAWRGIVADRAVPRRQRAPLFRALLEAVEIEVG